MASADQAARLQVIAANIEETYKSLKKAASNIAGLLQLGKATCTEIKAYNLWAMAIYNTQRGMLQALRQGGEKGVPDLPAAPTYFAWKGNTQDIDCASEPKSLSGLMGLALKGPAKNTRFVSTNEVTIVTQDPYVMNPEAAPTFKTLLQIQEQKAKAGLGWVGILIAIAGIAIAVSVAIAAIMHYLEVSEVQEANTKQVQLQAEAFASYTQARLSCMAQCTQSGKSQDECASVCSKLVTEPKFKLPGQGDGKWGMLQWIGFTVVAGVGTIAAWRLWQRHQSGKPIFQLPESVRDAISDDDAEAA